ncbi:MULTISPECIES: aldehyde dehydrogenase family protein [Bacteria]|uniref:aldehyde dehydrogenase family protein n=1 Tax=Bacteria TaxID=2 RepID=UPI003C7CE904
MDATTTIPASDTAPLVPPGSRAELDPRWLPAGGLVPSIVDGAEIVDGPRRECRDPYTGAVFAQAVDADPSQVERAIAAARRTFDERTWRGMHATARADVLDRVADIVGAEAPRLAALETIDTGKGYYSALHNDAYEAAQAFRYAASALRTHASDVRHGSYPPAIVPDGPELVVLRFDDPAGVVAELLPWNGPLMTGSQRIAMALAAGCSIVVKPPVDAVVSAVEIGRIALRAGVPAGVLNVVIGGGSTSGNALVTDPRIDLVSLTGGVETGKRVMAAAAQNLTPVHLELGGKSPAIVFEDADLDAAAQWITIGAFANQGEVCVAGTRVLVHESVYDALVEKIAQATAALPVGDPFDSGVFIGPLIHAAHAENVRGFIDRAVAGADAGIAAQGVLPEGAPATFVPPTLLRDVRPGSEVEQQEIFGPVLGAMSFTDEAEAIARANGTSFGLAGAVFTSDNARAFRVSRALDCGEVYVNTYYVGAINGGRGEPRRNSGFSRTGLEAYTRKKSVTFNVG